MEFDSYQLEKICSQISGNLIDYYGYDPLDHRTNPEQPDFDIEKLKRIKEKQIIVTQVKDLFYLQNQTSKQIAKTLNQPLKRVRGIIAILEAAEGEKIRRKQTEVMFKNGHQPRAISEVLGLSMHTINTWLTEMGYLSQGARIDHSKITPKSVIKRYHSREMKEKVLQLCKETDLKYSVIAKLTGIPRTTVNKWCKASTKKSRIYRPTQEQKSRAIELYQSTSLSFPAIAHIVKTSANTVRKWCSGIKRPED